MSSPSFRTLLRLICLATIAIQALPARADDIELEVFRDQIADEGESNFDFAANALQTPRHDDDARKTAFQAIGEYEYGLNDNWQIGLKLPLSYLSGTWKADGLLGEVKYVASHAKTGWYFGAEIEAGYESSLLETQQWNIEAVPVIGFRTDAWDLTLNPGVSIASVGEQRGTIVFEPSAKISYEIAKKTALGIEYFSEAGPLRGIYPANERSELAFLTLDTKIGKSVVNVGIGHGTNNASPGFALKTVLDIEFD